MRAEMPCSEQPQYRKHSDLNTSLGPRFFWDFGCETVCAFFLDRVVYLLPLRCVVIHKAESLDGLLLWCCPACC